MRAPRGFKREVARARAPKIAFDSRTASKPHMVGRYTRNLLEALRLTAPDELELVETHRLHVARARFELFHTPWLEGAVLRSPCPTVVTLHDLGALTRRSERLRRGGMHMRLRQLVLQRATQVIVHSDEMAEEALATLGLERERVVAIPQATAGSSAWSWEDVGRATWKVYERALSEPARPFVSRPRAASAQRGSS